MTSRPELAELGSVGTHLRAAFGPISMADDAVLVARAPSRAHSHLLNSVLACAACQS